MLAFTFDRLTKFQTRRSASALAVADALATNILLVKMFTSYSLYYAKLGERESLLSHLTDKHISNCDAQLVVVIAVATQN